MNRTKAHLAVLFADISGSGQLYESLGDSQAQKIATHCLAVLDRIARQFQGHVVKTIGDEVMCAFPDALLAGAAAVRMQEEVSFQSLSSDVKLTIQAGFHAGEVIQEDGDLFGDAVNLAARITALAKPLQILTTQETRAAFPPEWQAKMRSVGAVQFKGTQKEVALYEVLWGEEKDFTIMPEPVREPAPAHARMNLRYGTREIALNEKQPTVTIGRDLHNVLVIPDANVSRVHARIEYRQGRFFLIDQSTNGTHVVAAGGGAVSLHRDQLPLDGAGTITLGRGEDLLATRTIHYRCEA